MDEIGDSGSNACSATRGDDYPTTGHSQRKAAEDKRHTEVFSVVASLEG